MKTRVYFDIEPYKVKAIKKPTKKVVKVNDGQKSGKTAENEYIVIAADTEIIAADGETHSAREWLEKLEVEENITTHCSFPEHEDDNPSAFTSKKDSNSLFVFCNGCQRKGFYNLKPYSAKKAVEEIEQSSVSIDLFSNVIIQQLKTTGVYDMEAIVQQFLTCGTPISAFAGSLFFWLDGYWRKHDTQEQEIKLFVKESLHKILGKRPSVRQIKAVHIELLSEYREFTKPTDAALINFSNTLLMIKKGQFEFMEHNLHYGLRHQMPFVYDETAKGTKIDDFLIESMEDRATVDFFYDFLATLFIGKDLKIEKALFFLGTGSNGKSVVLDLVRALLGEASISSLPLKYFSNVEKRAIMAGKLLNISSEGSSSEISTEDTKAVISKETLPMRLLYKNLVETAEWPSCLFAGNYVFSTGGDYSYGMVRRFDFILFENIVSEDKQDRRLLQKLLPDLPSMMNNVLAGVERVLKNGGLITPPRVKEASKRFELMNNSVKYFFDSCGFIAGHETASLYDVKKLYKEFVDFCREEHISILNRRSFTSEVNSIHGKQQHSNKLYGWRIAKKIR